MYFIDLKQQYQHYKEEILKEIQDVLESAAFINGPAVKEFEKALAEHVGINQAIGCSSGTDALILALLVMDIQPGDEVIVPDFTFIATAETVAFLQAVPVFVDNKLNTYNIDPKRIEAKITEKTKGIIPVSLFGQCANFDEINRVAKRNNLWVIEDGAQSYGARYKDKKSGSLSSIGTTSFFPAKPLGCYGDGGAIFTDFEQFAAKMRMILNHGQAERYRHKLIGINGRLDSIQAAVLKVKLKHFDEEMQRKQEIAEMYTLKLDGYLVTPFIEDYNTSAWAQYTVRSSNREKIIQQLKSKNIPTAIHYPIPLHRQEVFSYLENVDGDFPNAILSSEEVFSLPMHPFMTKDDVSYITETIKEIVDA